MRLIAVLLLTLIAIPAHANLAGDVFGYECAKLDPKQTGFTCRLQTGRNDHPAPTAMYVHFVKHELPKEDAQYQFRAFLLRYFQLGGRYFELTSDKWSKRVEKCWRSKESMFSYSCEAHQ